MKKAFIYSIIFIFMFLMFACGMPEGSVDELPYFPGIETNGPEGPKPEEQDTDTKEPLIPEAWMQDNAQESAISKPEIQGPEASAPDKRAVCIKALVGGLNIRKGGSALSTSLGTMDKDDLLYYAGREGDWYVTYYQNSPAYVSAKPQYTILIDMKKGNEKTERILEAGYKLMGFPYVYGAVRLHNGGGRLLDNFNPGKYDCSSLMQYMFYYGASYNLQLTTRTQVYQGTPVNKKDLARGDLIFFTNASRVNNTGIERIGHVAIYLGNNYILHTASDHAVMEQISSTRWSYYIQANRFF